MGAPFDFAQGDVGCCGSSQHIDPNSWLSIREDLGVYKQTKGLFLKEVDYEYVSNSAGHWDYAGKVIKAAQEFREIFYAALELRFAIERLCFEYLVLLTYKKRPLSKKEKKLFRPEDILKRIEKEEPYLNKMLPFINEIFRLHGLDSHVEPLDAQWLKTSYGRLNNFLHARKEPLSDDEKQEFFQFVHESWKKLYPYVKTKATIRDMPDHAQAIFDAYAKDEIDLNSVRKRLELSNIPLHLLNPQ